MRFRFVHKSMTLRGQNVLAITSNQKVIAGAQRSAYVSSTDLLAFIIVLSLLRAHG